MKKTDTINLIEELCQKLSIAVKYDRFFGRGGFCRLRDRSLFIINENLSNDAKEEIFIKEFRAFDFNDTFLPPKLRDLFNKR
jgi:hypothetical protein